MSDQPLNSRHKSKLKIAFLTIAAVVAVVLVMIATYVYLQVRNPYRGKELGLQALPSTTSLKAIEFEPAANSDVGNPATISKLSPNKKYQVYIESRGLLCDSQHTVLVKHLSNNVITAIATLTEADPCSGVSFDTAWSQDNHFVKIDGDAYGIGHFEYLYDVNKNTLYKAAF